MIVDADAHWMEPAGLWSRHGLPIEGVGWNGLRVNGVDLLDEPHLRAGPDDPLAYVTGLARVYGSPPPWSAEQYVGMLDREGIDMAVLFPTRALGLLGSELSRGHLLSACAYYGDAVDAFVAGAGGRLRPVGLLPLAAPSLCPTFVEEAKARGFVGVVARPNPIAGLWLEDEELEDVWAAVAESGLPLIFHEGTGASTFLGQARVHTYLAAHAMSHPFEMMAAALAFTAGGILHRHPCLRVGFFESGAWWVPGWMNRLDDHATGILGREYALPELPSRYFMRQCAVTLDAGETAPNLWTRACLYASDLPHGDSAFPHSRGLTTRANPTPARPMPVFTDNPRWFFGLEDV